MLSVRLATKPSIRSVTLFARLVTSLFLVAGLAHANFGYLANYNRGNGASLTTVVSTAADGSNQAVAVDSSGKIVVVTNLANGGFLVGRYNADYTPDFSFGYAGVSIVNSAHNHFGVDVAIDMFNRIYVLGSTSSGSFLTRFTSSGAVDANNYGNAGYVEFGSCCSAHKLAVLSNGAAGVVGSRPGASGFFYSMVNANGAMRFSFQDGFESPVLGEDARAVAFDSATGMIVAVTTGDRNVGVMRYSNLGMRDSSFNNGSPVIIDFGLTNQFAADVVVGAGDAITVLAGAGFQTTQVQFILARINAQGQVTDQRLFNRGGTIQATNAFGNYSLALSGSFYWVSAPMILGGGIFSDYNQSLFRLSQSTFDFVTNFAHSGWMRDGIPGYTDAFPADVAVDSSANPVIVGMVGNN
jgi:hypothetical protein